jgi:hypothetical protein
MDPNPTPEAGVLLEDQLLTWQKTIDNASDENPFKATLDEDYNARASIQVGQWPIIHAIIGQTNIFENVRRRFSLGLAKCEINSPEFINTQSVFNAHLAKAQNIEFSVWVQEADALWHYGELPPEMCETR